MFNCWCVCVNYCNVHLMIKEGEAGEKWYCLVAWNQGRGNKNCLYNHPKGMTGKCDVYQCWPDRPRMFRKTMSAPGWTQKPFDLEDTEKESWGVSLHAHIPWKHWETCSDLRIELRCENTKWLLTLAWNWTLKSFRDTGSVWVTEMLENSCSFTRGNTLKQSNLQRLFSFFSRWRWNWKIRKA